MHSSAAAYAEKLLTDVIRAVCHVTNKADAVADVQEQCMRWDVNVCVQTVQTVQTMQTVQTWRLLLV